MTSRYTYTGSKGRGSTATYNKVDIHYRHWRVHHLLPTSNLTRNLLGSANLLMLHLFTFSLSVCLSLSLSLIIFPIKPFRVPFRVFFCPPSSQSPAHVHHSYTRVLDRRSKQILYDLGVYIYGHRC